MLPILQNGVRMQPPIRIRYLNLIPCPQYRDQVNCLAVGCLLVGFVFIGALDVTTQIEGMNIYPRLRSAQRCKVISQQIGNRVLGIEYQGAMKLK